jgi:hypothetical protein
MTTYYRAVNGCADIYGAKGSDVEAPRALDGGTGRKWSKRELAIHTYNIRPLQHDHHQAWP